MKQLSFVVFLIFAMGVIAGPSARATSVSPETVAGATTIDAARAKELFEKGVPFIDVRRDSDWDAGRIPGAEHLDLKSAFTEARLAETVGKADEVVIYCNGAKCMRSSEACAKAVSWGFGNVHYFRGGYPEWVAAGYPIE